MISKKFALKIFEAFSIERWNDMIRPFDMVEMDKSGERMVLAYIIGKFEEQNGNKIDWHWMMYASLFDLLKKIALCDMKSPVQRKIKSEYPAEANKIYEWVLYQYEEIIDDKELLSLFSDYMFGKFLPETPITERVYRAAHKYSTKREFDMLSVVNERERLVKVEKEINEDLQPYLDLTGLQLLVTKQKPYDFLMIIEQLRFQTRWNQTPRVPKTTVLGHCFFVAIFTLLLGRNQSVKFCPKREFNNYFSALFHDLPESVTRDIISPVKQATRELPAIVKNLEDEIVKSELVPLMEKFYSEELLYFTSDEFDNRICFDGFLNVNNVTFEQLNSDFNTDKYNPVDGNLVRCSDHVAAFIEADSSIKHGITSLHLSEGKNNIQKIYPKGKVISGFAIGDFFSEF
ncbi:MAG: HD domain-containing protein [Treponemataceae bacterium]|nr:HD domain-containing protein [Spirochaetales bacterium]MDY6031377.1 HD domain-containing protein [Treponemataceae bacterium]